MDGCDGDKVASNTDVSLILLFRSCLYENVNMYIYIYTNIYIYIHTYIYTYTYIYQSVKAQGTIQKIEKINVKSVNALIKVSQFMLKSKKSE